ncbi:glycine--tRNA ligase subunit beta, partial [Methylocystis sp.]|uniref:glycine--tRNA ligase subunit beta n=1 Tax=Methylocystis sp. TaxID=1911079 RepID=UPI003D14E507
MAELLIELFSEEIPARMQARAADQLREEIILRLHAFGFVSQINSENVLTFVTPRRLTAVAYDVPTSQKDVVVEKRGPKVGASAEALKGFMKSNGLTSIEQLTEEETPKGKFYFFRDSVAGQPTRDLLAETIPEIVYGFDWPRSMRWGHGLVRWVRPLHSVLCVFDGSLVDGVVQFPATIGTQAMIQMPISDTTYGHRFLSRRPIKVRSFESYQRDLRSAFVIVDQAERRLVIASQAEAKAKAAGFFVKSDEALLNEVTGLVEWPVVLMGRIDDAFMELPPEVLTTTMRTHQKYFAIVDGAGRLAPRFLLVSNMETKDKGAAIVAGNERVLRARLADAKFFWDQDRKATLESRVPVLKDIVFHAKLGTLADKMARVEALAVEIAKPVPGADEDKVRRAAKFAKADLTSGMVGEFPELQGIMGRYYALAEGEAPEVAAAIAEHYAPQGPNDECPTAPVSVALALADKLDSLAGFFWINEEPTGSKDPFALRRAALGAIRLIIENGLRFSSRRLFHQAISQQPDFPSVSPKRDRINAIADELVRFFADRMKVALKEKGVRHDLIAAVFALGGEDDLVRLLARVDALARFLAGEDGANLLTAQKRAANILRIEEKKDGKSYAAAPDAALLTQPEEKALHVALIKAAAAARDAVGHEDFTAAMAAMSELRKPVDAFFDKVTVNDADPALRGNRLKLL